MRKSWNAALSATLVLSAASSLLLGGCSKTDPIDPGLMADPDHWPSWGRTAHEAHFSPLEEINADNVSDLKLAWHFDLEPGYSASTPIEANGKLFITTGHSHIRALRADTGELLWEYDGGTRQRATSSLHFGWGNKGIAYSDGKVVLATTDGFIIALDENTGKEIWKIKDFPDQTPRTISGAPRIFGGKVIIGHGGADISPLRGYVSAYDLKSGKLIWRFYIVPGDPSKPAETKAEEIMRPTWKGDWFGKGGGGTAWNAFSFDEKLGLIYIGTGNGYPYKQTLRSPGGGDNLFLASIVAVKADTGDYVWHYQTCPAEQWDCTATTDMTLATVEINGKPRNVLMQAPKNGFLYVLDRATGELLSAEKIAKVSWAEKVDLKTGRPVENPGIRYGGKPGFFELWPGPTGAHSWTPQAYNPKTGLLYIPVIEKGALIGDVTDPQAIFSWLGVTVDPEAKLDQSGKSFLKAIDPGNGKERWRVELPGVWPAGVMTSGTNLVFQGRLDGQFVAYDASSGKKLWSFQAAAGIVGAPISYRVGGRQFVTVLTGASGHGAGMMTLDNAAIRSDYHAPRRVLAFALDGKDKLPRHTFPEMKPPADPGFVPVAAKVAKGKFLYEVNGCMLCHGANAVAGGAAPDLRYSSTITDNETFRSIVVQGALKANGMPPFPTMSPEQLDTLSHFLRARAKNAPQQPAISR